MNKHFSISYQQQYPEQVTIDQSYSNKFLGLGFKEICVYLQRIEHDTFPPNSSPNGFINIFWGYNPEKLPLTDLINNLEDIKNNLSTSQEIENQVKVHDFVLDDIIRNIDKIILNIKENGIDKTFDKYSKEIDFILKTGENTIIQNNVNMQTFALSFIDIQEILQKVYNQISLKIKKEFAYDIDFIYLTCMKK
ncbi:hypothetical protein [Coprobacter fastidiosus]